MQSSTSVWYLLKMSFEMPNNPAELAEEIVRFRLQDPGYGYGFDNTIDDELDIKWLDETADSCNFLGNNWQVEARLGFAIPIDCNDQEEVEYLRYDGLHVLGELISFSRVSICKLTGSFSVRAICLAFERGYSVFSPVHSEVNDDSLLHVPVMSVSEMTRL